MLLKQQQQQQHSSATSALQYAALEKHVEELESSIAQINAVSASSNAVAAAQANPPVSSTQLALLKKQVAGLEEMLGQMQQGLRINQQVGLPGAGTGATPGLQSRKREDAVTFYTLVCTSCCNPHHVLPGIPAATQPALCVA